MKFHLQKTQIQVKVPALLLRFILLCKRQKAIDKSMKSCDNIKQIYFFIICIFKFNSFCQYLSVFSIFIGNGMKKIITITFCNNI